MKLIVVRHAHATDASPTGLDIDRPLSEQGVVQAERLSAWLASAHEIDEVITSPAVRTRETAAPLVAKLGIDAAEDERLWWKHPPSAAVEIVREHAEREVLVFVGHNPQVATLVPLLTDGPTGGAIRFRKAQAFVLEVDGRDPVGTAQLVERVHADDLAET